MGKNGDTVHPHCYFVWQNVAGGVARHCKLHPENHAMCGQSPTDVPTLTLHKPPITSRARRRRTCSPSNRTCSARLSRHPNARSPRSSSKGMEGSGPWQPHSEPESTHFDTAFCLGPRKCAARPRRPISRLGSSPLLLELSPTPTTPAKCHHRDPQCNAPKKRAKEKAGRLTHTEVQTTRSFPSPSSACGDGTRWTQPRPRGRTCQGACPSGGGSARAEPGLGGAEVVHPRVVRTVVGGLVG